MPKLKSSNGHHSLFGLAKLVAEVAVTSPERSNGRKLLLGALPSDIMRLFDRLRLEQLVVALQLVEDVLVDHRTFWYDQRLATTVFEGL